MQTSERPPPNASKEAKSMLKPGESVEENPSRISSERAFADFVLGSLILHGFCVNFIN
jgi:DAD family